MITHVFYHVGIPIPIGLKLLFNIKPVEGGQSLKRKNKLRFNRIFKLIQKIILSIILLTTDIFRR